MQQQYGNRSVLARPQEASTSKLLIGQFLGALCHYIKTCLGDSDEHMQRLCEVGSCNAFIREPIATKDMWDGVQSAHSKTLSCSFVTVLTNSSKRANVAIELRDMMEEIMECGQRTLALHLRIAARHEDIRRLGQCSCNHWCASTKGLSFRVGWMMAQT
jgi:hypothetical protein